MPAKKTDSSESTSVNGLRDNELRFIKAVFDNMTQKPDANWAQVANDLGLKDAKCAKERFRQMSVRHGWRSNSQTTTPGSSPSGKSRKSNVTGPSGNGKVTKKPKAKTTKKAVAKKEESEDDNIKNEDDYLKEEETEDGPFF